jgi:dTDP-D-glucose 4,6-dehydratase
LEQQLQNLVTIPDSLFAELLDNIQQSANLKYKELVEASIRTVDQADGKDQRRTHEEKRMKAQLTYDQICSFELGLADLAGFSFLHNII